MPSDALLAHAAQFNLPGHLTVTAGRHQMPCLDIANNLGRGRVYLQGATVTDWQPAGHRPVLFTSRASYFKVGMPIRGGVPLCLPWFGDHASDPDAPKHGLVRTKSWNLVSTAEQDGEISAELTTNLEHLHFSYRLTFGPTLSLKLTTSNVSQVPQKFESALHTYLSVGDIHQASVDGLGGARYRDAMLNSEMHTQSDPTIRFTAETDRVYLDTASPCTLTDPKLGRRIVVSKTGSNSTVVWNPWIAKAARMEDFGDEEWTQMCCIESGNIGPNAITLPPAGSFTTEVTLAVEML